MKATKIAVFVVGVILLIFWTRMRKTEEGFEDVEKYKMVMYGVKWCPHCVSAKPEFEKLGATRTIDGKLVEFAVVDPEENPAAAEGKEIRGYPTFHLYDSKGELVKEYGGDRSEAGILKFLENTL